MRCGHLLGVPERSRNGQERTRYRNYQGYVISYAPGTSRMKPRLSVKKMVQRETVYRKEDIEAAVTSVQPRTGARVGQILTIWFYKGGARCHHFWKRQTYLRKEQQEDLCQPSEETHSEKRESMRSDTENDKRVAQRPVDMPNEGFINPR